MIPLTRPLIVFRAMVRHGFSVKFEVLVVRISMILHRGLLPVYEIFERMDLRYCFGLAVSYEKNQFNQFIYISSNTTIDSNYRLVLGRFRFDFVLLVPSNTCKAARSSADIRLKHIPVFFVGDVDGFAVQTSKRIFSLRLRRSSSIQSRCLLGRQESNGKKNHVSIVDTINTITYYLSLLY